LGKEKRQAFYQRFHDQALNVLVEGRPRKEMGWRGLSRNYIPVSFRDDNGAKRRDWTNQEVKVIVTELTERGVLGKVVEDKL